MKTSQKFLISPELQERMQSSNFEHRVELATRSFLSELDKLLAEEEKQHHAPSHQQSFVYPPEVLGLKAKPAYCEKLSEHL